MSDRVQALRTLSTAFPGTRHQMSVTGGCPMSPPLLRPNTSNTRGEMAVLLDKTFGF